MARFIDSDKLICQVQNNDKYGTIIKQVFISLLQNSETEDVAPVVHAHWIVEPYRGDLLRYACSNPKCKYYEFHVYKEYRGSNYCPNCGAIMDEEVE